MAQNRRKNPKKVKNPEFGISFRLCRFWKKRVKTVKNPMEKVKKSEKIQKKVKNSQKSQKVKNSLKQSKKSIQAIFCFSLGEAELFLACLSGVLCTNTWRSTLPSHSPGNREKCQGRELINLLKILYRSHEHSSGLLRTSRWSSTLKHIGTFRRTGDRWFRYHSVSECEVVWAVRTPHPWLSLQSNCLASRDNGDSQVPRTSPTGDPRFGQATRKYDSVFSLAKR